MCFQDPRLLPWRNSLDNVTLPLELAGISPDERQDRGIDMLRMVGMGDAWNRMPAQLSGGMRMRVGLARALVERPPALLLDEPCSALDEITRETINELLADLWKELGMTVVLVTHSLAEAVYLGRQVVVMTGRPGRVVSVHGIHLPSRQPEVRTTVEFAQALQSIYRDMTLPRPPGGIAPSSLSKHAGAEP
jgi:NitT/TauT family transport system ATP-binding protein